MAKEQLMEDLVKRAGEGVGGATVGDGVWKFADGSGDYIHLSFLGVASILALLLSAVVIFFCYVAAKNGKHSKYHNKKKHNFNIREKYFKNRHKTPPVSNPDKGSHYLKKSPSPTGVKSPPGIRTTAEDFLHHKTASKRDQQTRLTAEANALVTTYCENELSADGLSVGGSCPGSRRSSGAPIIGKDANSGSATVEYHQALNDDDLGSLHFTMKYDFDKTALVVTVNRCDNLPAKDAAAKSSDPYVKLQLLPEKQHKVKTRVMRRTLNPVYDEDFTFYGVNYNQLPGLTLHFVVLSFDRYSRDDVIGEVLVEMRDHDLSSSDHSPLALVKEIQPRCLKIKTQGRGELLVSLCYQPAANRITAVVLKARNLPKMDITGLSDPYVKIYLLYNDQRIAKKKTHVKKRTLNPVFNESFVFDLPQLDPGESGEPGVRNISLEFCLLDWDRVTKNEVIGRLELGGKNSSGSALHHWNEVIHSPRRQIAEWHKLEE